MQRIGSRELKNRLGRYLWAVRKGQTLLITDRGKPVAKLAPANGTAPVENAFLEKLHELEAKGLIRLAKEPLGKFRPARSKGKPASRIIIEDLR